MDCPSDKTLPSYMPTLAEQGVRHVVRVSGQAHAYDTAPLADAGIRVHDGMRFDDGTPPPPHVVSSWLALVERTFDVLVALALVEFDGMDPLEAVELVRKRRRGALNKQQLQWLSTYKRGRWRKTKAPASPLPLPPPGRPSGAKRTLFFACCGGGDHV
ncbi:MAG: hypothetical protein BJ554DRAFT_2555 [Olpidium bornovanus]|uniref:Uncharacterized protein n=1 Tax=Olpidium bornovanus TaxID=278681 RepID=A0A8H8A121_9FUNG|nr:MAG: hypothetical protein BJ554DRAFT_2555 [Olpidium bornovanus]